MSTLLGGITEVEGSENSLEIDALAKFAVDQHNTKEQARMASAQQHPATATLSDKNKAIMAEMVKEAKSLSAQNKLTDKIILGGLMMNSDEYDIMRYKTHNWAGQFKTSPPENISNNGEPGKFVHEGLQYPLPIMPPTPYGSIGAVVYGNYMLTKDKQVNNVGIMRGWLLAWSLHDDQHHVYVESGSLEDIMKLKWDEVRPKLEKSGTTTGTYLQVPRRVLQSPTWEM